MKILVTGSDGYIGALLAPMLLERGHQVLGLDTGFYREGWLYNIFKKSPATTSEDIRNATEDTLKGFHAVVHLAELSNDPLGQLNPKMTYEINHVGTIELAKKCKRVGISRFVYTSSCSVYGVGSDEYKTEQSSLNPQTAYAKCKALVERDLAEMADDRFSPTFLRNATAYGSSPRMRFDLVLNNLAGMAWATNKIGLLSDGTPWRPLVHVLDICEAVTCTLEASRQVVHKEIFNVGDTKENYQVKEIAHVVADTFPGCELTFGEKSHDNRSYRVSFEKINRRLPGFRCQRDILAGANELREVFERISLSLDSFESRGFTRLRQLEYLITTGQIDDRFFWK